MLGTRHDLLRQAIFLGLLLWACSAPIPDDCQQKWAEQRLDHFRCLDKSYSPDRLTVQSIGLLNVASLVQ
jgi:hypothetical protein